MSKSIYMYVPPFVAMLGLLGRGETASVPAEGEKVAIPFGCLRLLLSAALASAPFDEEGYLRINPDVAGAVLRGEIDNGREHFLNYGYFEGRQGAGEEFAEEWYLRANPDVADAVEAGHWPSGRDHYEEVGVYESRNPNPTAETNMDMWRAWFQGRTPGFSAQDLKVGGHSAEGGKKGPGLARSMRTSYER